MDDGLPADVDRLLGSWGLAVSPADRSWLLTRARMVAEDAALLAAVAQQADDATTASLEGGAL